MPTPTFLFAKLDKLHLITLPSTCTLKKMPVLYKLCMDCASCLYVLSDGQFEGTSASCLYVLSDGQFEGTSFGVAGGHKPSLANWHSGEILPLFPELL
jgi:hypothetical protein